MLAFAAPTRSWLPSQAAKPARRSVVQVAAAARSGGADFLDEGCPLLEECAGKQAKSSCVHPGRPLNAACADCPRKKGRVMMAKAKCIHPQRPLSAACKDCPRLKK